MIILIRSVFNLLNDICVSKIRDKLYHMLKLNLLSLDFGDGTFLFHLLLNVTRIIISFYFLKVRKISRSEIESKL